MIMMAFSIEGDRNCKFFVYQEKIRGVTEWMQVSDILDTVFYYATTSNNTVNPLISDQGLKVAIVIQRLCGVLRCWKTSPGFSKFNREEYGAPGQNLYNKSSYSKKDQKNNRKRFWHVKLAIL